ncbi:lachesin-like isoform X1 [Daktulosphaira vitifoliae]|uniref:lachesin-like isoform X1 n=1 Tax=Daktulosphaira vitifoliae TaxID=58002 RepID=UPI0021AA59E0|nr:lachesin-like isoform X1 [Daktulosphaira vitifoliae]
MNNAIGIIFTLLVINGAIIIKCQIHDTVEVLPEFYAPLENWTVTQGRDVSFTCTVNNLGSYKVAWIKSDSKAILAIHTNLIAHNHRLAVTHNGHNTWKLHVYNVQKNDTGSYMCQINTEPMIVQTGYLDVRIPPDIIDEDDLSGPGSSAMEGGTVRLRCRSTGKPEPKVYWKRKDNRHIIIRSDETKKKQESATVKGDTLELNNVHRTDMGKYLCIAKNNVPPTVSKEFNVQVHFHPMIKVTNQLVAAPIGSNVHIQCYVETSPKAMHSWAKINGADLIPSSKYKITETPINEYSLQMNLIITSLEPKDFGGYLCIAKNALGIAEGSIRLQELHLPSIPTSLETPMESEEKEEIEEEDNINNWVPLEDFTTVSSSRQPLDSQPDYEVTTLMTTKKPTSHGTWHYDKGNRHLTGGKNKASQVPINYDLFYMVIVVIILRINTTR